MSPSKPSLLYSGGPPEESDAAGRGGAQAEAAEVRTRSPDQPEQGAGPPQEDGGEQTDV